MDCMKCSFSGYGTHTCNNECEQLFDYHPTHETSTVNTTDCEMYDPNQEAVIECLSSLNDELLKALKNMEIKLLDERRQKNNLNVLLGERNAGKRTALTKQAINYILDREYEKAQEVLDELQEL